MLNIIIDNPSIEEFVNREIEKNSEELSSYITHLIEKEKMESEKKSKLQTLKKIHKSLHLEGKTLQEIKSEIL